MKAFKLELTKFNDSQIIDGFVCIPLPKPGTSEDGIFLNKTSDRVYVDAIVWENDEPDQYGNIGSVQVSLSKADRESGKKGAYIGNIKEF
jgi:hypothetical protein